MLEPLLDHKNSTKRKIFNSVNVNGQTLEFHLGRRSQDSYLQFLCLGT